MAFHTCLTDDRALPEISQIVYEAMIGLQKRDKEITTKALIDATGLGPSELESALKSLDAWGAIKTKNGEEEGVIVYEPTGKLNPPRPTFSSYNKKNPKLAPYTLNDLR